MESTTVRPWRTPLLAVALAAALLIAGCTSRPAVDPGPAEDPVAETPAEDAPVEEAPVVEEPAPAEPAAPAGPVLPASDGSSPYGIWTAPDGSSAYLLDDGSCAGMYYNAGQPLDIGGPMTCVVDGDKLLVRQAPNQATYTIAVTSSTLNFLSGGQLITFRR